MLGVRKLLVVASWAMVLAGCSTVRRTDQVAVDYNRTFAGARDKLILLNILRAGAREPLQFSTISQVSGGVRNSGSLQVPFSGLIRGGPLAISPTLTVNDGVNPAVTMIPLGQKEFTQGLLRPIDAATVDLFLGQGRGRELVLPLAIGGVVCEADQVLLNTGEPGLSDAVARAAEGARNFDIPATRGDLVQTVKLPSKDALAVLKDGLGTQFDVSVKEPQGSKKQSLDTVVLEVRKKAKPRFENIDMSGPCAARNWAPKGGRSAEVLLRSPAAMFFFLGELHRRLEEHPAARFQTPAIAPFVAIHRCGPAEPAAAAVSVIFRGQRYCVYRQSRRTLEVISFLSDIIALQTSEATIAANNPILAITR